MNYSSHLKILHVDDEKNFLTLFALKFKKWFQIDSVDTPLKVDEMLETGNYQAVVMDYDMPDINGIELLKEVKEKFPDIPVVFYTGQGNEEVARDAFIHGVSDYFTKDITGFFHIEKIANSIMRAVEIIKSEKSRKESEEKYRRIFENIQDVYFEESLDGVIIEVSPSIEDLLGYKREEFIGTKSSTHQPPGQRENLEAEILKKGAIIDLEIFAKNKNGDYIPVSLNTKILRDEEGNIQKFIGTMHDIGERKKYEDAVRSVLISTESLPGKDFFDAMTNKLWEILKADITLIGKITPDAPDVVRTVSICFHGEIIPNAQYLIEGTASKLAFASKNGAFVSGVKDKFPDYSFFKKENIESYVGIPLFDSQKNPLGVLVALFSKPLSDSKFTESILKLFAGRVAAEIDRVSIEESLEEKSRQFEQITGAIREVLWIASSDLTKIEYISPAYEKIWKKNREEVYNDARKWINDLSAEDQSKLIEFLDNLSKDIKERSSEIPDEINYPEFTLTDSDGILRWVKASAYPIRDEAGDIIKFVGIIEDITSQKIILNALEESESKYRMLFEEMSEGAGFHRIVTDDAGRPVDYIFLDVNRSFEKMTGLSRENILNRKVTEVIPGILEDDFDWVGTYGKVALEGGKIKFEHFFKPFNRWYEVTAYSPKKNHFVAIFYDVTGNKRIEMNLMEKEERYRNLFEHSSVAICEEDYSEIRKYFEKLRSDGIFDFMSWFSDNPEEIKKMPSLIKVIDLNNECLDLFGEKNKADLISNLPQFLAENSWDLFGEKIVALAEGKTRFEAEFPIRIADGRVKTVSLKLSVDPTCMDTLSRILVSFTDITKMKIIEQELLRKNEELNEFVFKVSHDLKTPVNLIRGFAEVIREEPSFFGEYFGRIISQTEQISNFINRLLNLSRAGRIIFKKENVDLESLISIEFESEIKSAAVLGELLFECHLPLVYGDFFSLKQAFANLIHNSIKFRDPEKEKLVIRISHEIENGNIIISFSDNGIGIDDKNMDKIFKPGYSAGKERGTGFGLTIVNRIIEAHGGEVWVKRSNKEKGTTFCIRLPLAAQKGG